MASTIRYDFSFPPKSNSNNNNQGILNPNFHNNNNNSSLSLTRSTSASLLAHNNNNNNNSNSYCSNCNVNSKCGLQNAGHHQHGHQNGAFPTKTPTISAAAALCVMNGNNGASSNILTQALLAHGAPVTPKDANCSFTFDELKNTLSFMEDSPLANPNHNIHSQLAQQQQLMIEATMNAPVESSLSSASSTSSYSSALSSTSASSCATTEEQKHQPIIHIPVKELFNSVCNCTTASDNNNNNTPSVGVQHESNGINLIETLLIKKSPTLEHKQHSVGYMSSSTSSNSISMIPKSNSNNHLLQASVGGGYTNEIESAAKKYRCAAQISEATCSWKGKLPPKSYRTPIVYSTKVFVGGLPWDITEEDLVKEFGTFGPCRVEWTNKEKFNLLSGNHGVQQQQQFRNYRSVGNLNNGGPQQQQQQRAQNDQSKQRSSPGFAYVIYDNEYSVRSLVNNCIEDYANGRDRVEFYFKISTRRVRNKEVQIIPWILADNNFALCTPKELDPKKTVFVGNLHGTMTARDLAHIMNELFGSVVYAGIDIDKLKYPIGSGRVTFANQQNFMRAVRAAFVDIQASKFSKRIQIDPYLEDVQCCICFNEKGIYFCRDFQCFNYYCGACWSKQHSFDVLGNHKPLMRKREDNNNKL